MPLYDLSIFWTVIIDIFAWFLFHMAISFGCLKIPASFFEIDSFLYRIQDFEDEGDLWNRLFKIKNWKRYIPDGTIFIKSGVNKEKLMGISDRSLLFFLNESKRAEFTHWLSILPAPLFFLWNPIWAGWVMIAYALLLNVPIIMTQRFNRGRIERIVNKRATKKEL